MAKVDIALTLEQQDEILVDILRDTLEETKAFLGNANHEHQIDDILMYAKVIEACETLIKYHTVQSEETDTSKSVDEWPTPNKSVNEWPAPKFNIGDEVRILGNSYMVYKVAHVCYIDNYTYVLKDINMNAVHKFESALIAA